MTIKYPTALKPESTRQRDIDNKVICAHSGCNEPITPMKGPGSKLCIKHQLNDSRNGGLGNARRDHTLNKKDHCERCGLNPFEEPRWKNKSDSSKRKMLHVHHIEQKQYGHEDVDRENNCLTLCPVCHYEEHENT